MKEFNHAYTHRLEAKQVHAGTSQHVFSIQIFTGCKLVFSGILKHVLYNIIYNDEYLQGVLSLYREAKLVYSGISQQVFNI